MQEYVLKFIPALTLADLHFHFRPWYLTSTPIFIPTHLTTVLKPLLVVRTQGVLFLRPEKSWRPVVSVSLVDAEQTIPETALGCDGQNPNMKIPLALCVSIYF